MKLSEEKVDAINYVKKGYINPVGHQKKCGSCVVFASCGLLEAQIFKKTGKLVKLSEQQLLECTKGDQWRADGCEGAITRGVLEYIKANGITTNSKYVRPYTAVDTKACAFKSSSSVAKIKDVFWYMGINEDSIENILNSYGPLIITIDGSQPTFLLYKSGVYKDSKCSSSNVNHAMLLVGYDRDSKFGDYWLIKNSFGVNWGEDGYFRLERGRNRCGITAYVLYATIQ